MIIRLRVRIPAAVQKAADLAVNTTADPDVALDDRGRVTDRAYVNDRHSSSAEETIAKLQYDWQYIRRQPSELYAVWLAGVLTFQGA